MEQFTALKRKALEKYFSRMNDQQRKAVFKIKDLSLYWQEQEAARPLFW